MQTLAFLLDVDNTLLDNDAIKADWDQQLQAKLGSRLAKRFWQIYEQVRKERGVVDIPLALARLREETPNPELDERTYQFVRELFNDYPFHKRLYPYAIETLQYLRTIGLTVIVSDGDPVFQMEKIVRSLLAAAVEGRVLLYTHKQEHLGEITQTYPANHYVMIDDHPQVLCDSSRIMKDRLTTIFVKQGHYANGKLPEGFAPDFTIPQIGDLRYFQKEQFL